MGRYLLTWRRHDSGGAAPIAAVLKLMQRNFQSANLCRLTTFNQLVMPYDHRRRLLPTPGVQEGVRNTRHRSTFWKALVTVAPGRKQPMVSATSYETI